MKRSLVCTVFLLVLLGFQGCGPILVSHDLADPPPPWFYPNRIEALRYVYFPEFSIYYDLSARTYIYWDGGVWQRKKELPSRYRTQDLARSRYERIRNYYDDDIKRYHERNNADRGRSNKSVGRRDNP